MSRNLIFLNYFFDEIDHEFDRHLNLSSHNMYDVMEYIILDCNLIQETKRDSRVKFQCPGSNITLCTCILLKISYPSTTSLKGMILSVMKLYFVRILLRKFQDRIGGTYSSLCWFFLRTSIACGKTLRTGHRPNCDFTFFP